MFALDDAEVREIIAANRVQADTTKKARAIAIQTRKQVRRVKCEAVLAGILPQHLERDTSYHVMSHGDVDSLSYLRHIVTAQPLEYVSISTWVIARNDIDEIAGWLDGGRVQRIDFYLGEIFPGQYGDEHAQIKRVMARNQGRIVIARNHSKVMLAMNAAEDYYAAIESSANVNTNPRIEQTSIHRSEDLFHFYKDFFDGLRTIDRH